MILLLVLPGGRLSDCTAAAAHRIIEVVLKCKVKPFENFFYAHETRLQDRRACRAAQIPATTVRYYERIGLLVPDDRSQGNYRLYSQASLQRLRFIRAAQSTGFSLDNVNAILGSHGGKAPSCGDVQTLIEARLSDIKRRLQDLHHIERVLKSSLQRCKKESRADCCHVVQTLHGKS